MATIKHRSQLWKVLPPGKEAMAAEIGVAEGLFAEEMLQWPVKLSRLYLVDRWKSVPSQKGDASLPKAWHDTNYEEMMRRMVPFGDRAVVLRGDSVGMASQVTDGSLALVNIDADHSFEGCLRDIRAWAPKVTPGGIMSFHDYENSAYGVKAAVQSFLEDCYGFALFLLPENKPADAGAYIVFPDVNTF